MSDLISRQAAIEALKRAEALTRAFGYHHVIDTIRDLPTAKPSTTLMKVEVGVDKESLKKVMEETELTLVAEPRTGNWIVHKSPDEYHCGMVECPFCREELIAEPNEYCYCPNCGARMEKGDG